MPPGQPIPTGLAFPDGELVRNTRQQTRTHGVELSRRHGAARGTAIVRAGHPSLDLALAAEAMRHHAAGTVAAIREATGHATVPEAATLDAPSPTLGRVPGLISISSDRRTGASTTIHHAFTRSVIGPDGKRRQLRIWHELTQQSWN